MVVTRCRGLQGGVVKIAADIEARVGTQERSRNSNRRRGKAKARATSRAPVEPKKERRWKIGAMAMTKREKRMRRRNWGKK